MTCRPNDRLAHLQDVLHLSTSQFSTALGLPLARTRRLMRPGRTPTVGLLARVRRCFPQVNPDWLLSGEGDVLCSTRPTGNAIGTNYGTATQTIHYHFNGLPTDRLQLINLLAAQIQFLQSAA
jgi:hypothetical protein